MLSIFPSLFAFEFFAPLILRAVVGAIFVYFGYTKIYKDKVSKISSFESVGMKPAKMFFWASALLEIVGGLFLILGLYTQVAAAVLSIIIIGAIYMKIRKPAALSSGFDFLILILAVLVSLLFLGGGIWAIDLPL